MMKKIINGLLILIISLAGIFLPQEGVSQSKGKTAKMEAKECFTPLPSTRQHHSK
jgi:hypothetical protein